MCSMASLRILLLGFSQVLAAATSLVHVYEQPLLKLRQH
jgi:hypothetical protein